VCPEEPRLTVPPTPVPPRSSEFGSIRISDFDLRLKSSVVSVLTKAPRASILCRLYLALVVKPSSNLSLRYLVRAADATDYLLTEWWG
jgi:hypothetical protein